MLVLEDIQISYGDFIAVDHINFEVRDAEFFTLLGPSGCGKSTTLKAIAGFEKASKGKIFLDGKDITYTPPENKGIGMVFQSYALFPTMTVYDNIAFGLDVSNIDEDSKNKRVSELARLVDLSEDQINRNVSDLSGGQQQRVAIARALAKEPSTVLFDEPLSNLDAKLRKQLRMELKRIQRTAGMTSIYVTHDQEEALTLSDRIAVFNKGFIDQIGTPEEIYNKSATEFVCNFIGDVNKLTPAFLDNVNAQSNYNKLNPEASSYVRIEKITSNLSDGSDNFVTFDGRVIDKEYYGTFTSYTYQIGDAKVRTIEKEDGQNSYQIGESVPLFLNPMHILQYDQEGKLISND